MAVMIDAEGIASVGGPAGPGYGPKDMAVTIVESIVPAPAVEAAEENAAELDTEASHGMIAPPAP